MDILFQSVMQYVIEIMVIMVGSLLSVVLAKVKSYVNTLKKKDETGIVDMITDTVVEYAEAELSGSHGIVKRDFAIDKAIAILNDKGIVVSKEEVVAGIEQGVNKLKAKQPK
ncbi:phage holin family protein [Cytobacillus kochii]|uniref:phage holin, LLH family n=1 Tax=Cytobacillus kochii TaxID=859143 RepID=UPI001CD7DD1D|nr:phage holin, LLH family [Cytobacillus kochii]MCA1025649.1 phage holin family protein [Cytobacillus kochii]